MLPFITIYLIIGFLIVIVGDYQLRTDNKAREEMEEMMYGIPVSPNIILTLTYIIVIIMWPFMVISLIMKKK